MMSGLGYEAKKLKKKIFILPLNAKD